MRTLCPLPQPKLNYCRCQGDSKASCSLLWSPFPHLASLLNCCSLLAVCLSTSCLACAPHSHLCLFRFRAHVPSLLSLRLFATVLHIAPLYALCSERSVLASVFGCHHWRCYNKVKKNNKVQGEKWIGALQSMDTLFL